MKNKKWKFETVEELVKFVKELEESPTEALDVDYFRLTAVLRAKQNRKLENESDVYIYREIGSKDTLTDMKIAGQEHSRRDTAWMTRIPIIMTTNKKGD